MQNAVWKSRKKRVIKKYCKAHPLLGGFDHCRRYFKYCRKMQRRFLKPLIILKPEATDAN